MSSTPPRERDSNAGPASVVATPQHSAEQLVGQMIDGKYRVDRVIGMGGMGVVVAATQLQLDRTVAIKLVRQDMANDPSAVDQLLREARAAARIVNEHVADVLDFGTLPGGAPFIVMEYLEGEDLAQVLETGGPLPVGIAIDLVLQACEALAEAHLKGIVHRDLKPGNLFISRLMGGSPCLKIVDFGISKRVKSETLHLALTTSPRILGTPNYMAPEQMRGHASGPQADIWALGAIVFELITGRAAFQAETLPRLCQKVLAGRPPSLRQYCPDAPDSLERIILRCLNKDLEDRYQDVSLLARDLAPFGRRRARLSLEHIVAMNPTGTGPAADDIAATVPEALAHVGQDGVAVPGKPVESTFQLSDAPGGRLDPLAQAEAASPPDSEPAPSSTGPHSPSTLADVPHSISIPPPGATRRHQVIALSLAGIVGVGLLLKYALREGPSKTELVTHKASALQPNAKKKAPKAATRPENTATRPTTASPSPAVAGPTKGRGLQPSVPSNGAEAPPSPSAERRSLPTSPLPTSPLSQDSAASQRSAGEGQSPGASASTGPPGASGRPEPTVRPISETNSESPRVGVASPSSPAAAAGKPKPAEPANPLPARAVEGRETAPSSPPPPATTGPQASPPKTAKPPSADPWNHETFGPRL